MEAEDLGKNPLVLVPSIQCLVMHSFPPLHNQLLPRLATFFWKLEFVHAADVPVIGLKALAQLKEVGEDFVEHFNVRILTSKVRTLDLHQVPCQDVHAQLFPQGGLPRWE